MPAPVLRIYLDYHSLRMARAGVFGFVRKVVSAFEGAGLRVELVSGSDSDRLKSAARRGYALFHMEDPFHDRALTMRRAYYYPYWRIEASARRWEFEVARKSFDPAEIDPDAARDWVANWRRWLFRRGPETAERSGMIYVALQGRLLDQRSFQSMSPLEMVAEVQARAGTRRIHLGLHPGETYTEAEMDAVTRLAEADPRVTLETGGMDEALRTCDLVVTQNSTAALSGFFFEKPAILFGQSDFHHQMPSVAALGVDEAFRRAEAARPDFAAYLYWFVELNAIKADTPEAEAKILARCRDLGWDF